jgi:16S rRNA (uracil1498-N3)-methyltransferase
MPWEEERRVNLKRVFGREGKEAPFRPFSINLFIGPEGGFTPEEVTIAQQYGIVPITLGPRILRAETAGLVAVAAILYELGDLS